MKLTQKLGAAAGAVALSLGTSAFAQDAVQWRVEDGGNGHWYGRSASPANWDASQVWARAHGGNLASITSAAEIFAVQALSDGCWIGARKLTGLPWEWADGEVWNFTNWCPGEPCCFDAGLYVYASPAGCWDDHNQSETQRLGLIEWSADCNSDGIVDFGQILAGELPDVNANGVPDTCEPHNGGPYPAVQWAPKSGGNGNWYQAVVAPQGLGWSAARALAASLGGRLACAESEGEKSFFFNEFGPSEVPSAWIRQAPWTEPNFGPWIGGTQDPGSGEPFGGWRWIGGPAFNPTELGCCDDSGCAGPEDRLHLLLSQGMVTWNDLPDTWTCGTMPSSLLVEWSSDCNSDGIVDFGQILAGELEDANRNNIPDCCEGASSCNCPGDVARDGVVNGIDLAAVLNNWGTSGGAINADANGDGIVDAEDLALVLSSWGECP